MGISPQELMRKNGFKKKMDEYVKKLETYIDSQINSRYDSFLEHGRIQISEHKLNAHLFRQKKNLPLIIRETLLQILRPLYPGWRIEEETAHHSGEHFFIFIPIPLSEKKEEKQDVVLSEDISLIENRSELLDLGGE